MSTTISGLDSVIFFFSKGSFLLGLDMVNDEYTSYDVDADADGDIDESSVFNDGNSTMQNHQS